MGPQICLRSDLRVEHLVADIVRLDLRSLLLQLIGNVVPWLGLNTHGGLILIYAAGALCWVVIDPVTHRIYVAYFGSIAIYDPLPQP